MAATPVAIDSSHPPRVHSLVADTAAFIRAGVRLDALARRVLTTPDVLAEVRDPRARATLDLARALSDVQVRAPSQQAIAAVAAAARSTGDFGVLSVTDLRVVALVWMLAKEAEADAHHPQSSSAAAETAPLESLDATRPVSSDSLTETALPIESDALLGKFQDLNVSESNCEEASDVQDVISNDLTPLEVTHTHGVNNDDHDHIEIEEEESEEDEANDAIDGDSDGGEWITPSNVKRMKELHEQRVKNELAQQETVQVACITSDFAMQNVLFHLGLKVVSIDGILIKHVKSWIMRCHACFKTTPDTTKVFCPTCGGNTLTRVSCTVNSNGKMTIHLKKNYQHKVRGTKYSLPAPKGGHAGKMGGDIILREDQKEYVAGVKAQKMVQKKLDFLDADFVQFGDGVRRSAGVRVVVGHGSRNPNANTSKGRRRR
ncbi:Nin1 binding protein [Entophlyctis sp. JEL0112]|nr:Nin1 binding protein [Entophlyctis sp. JEL0112]